MQVNWVDEEYVKGHVEILKIFNILIPTKPWRVGWSIRIFYFRIEVHDRIIFFSVTCAPSENVQRPLTLRQSMSTHNNRTYKFCNNRSLEELWCQQLKTTDPNPGWLWSSSSRLWSHPPSVSCRCHQIRRCYSLQGLHHRRRKTWSWIRNPHTVHQKHEVSES